MSPRTAEGAPATTAHRTYTPRRGGPVVLLVAGALAVGVGTGWAGHRVLAPPPQVVSDTGATYVEVSRGEVASSMRLTALALWAPEAAGTNLASGTVTSVAVSPGQDVGQGSVLYAVDLRPVVIARGQIPAFRAMTAGTAGDDVAQLQTMLTDLGYRPGPADGRFSGRTTSAVRDWQRDLDVPVDGTVQASDIIFVTDLPARIVLDPDVVARGARLGGGEVVLSRLPESPGFTIPVSATQSDTVPDDTTVTVEAPDGTSWSAVVAGRTVDQDAVVLTLAGPSGDAVCASSCALVPVGDKSHLDAEIVLVAPAEGLRVPSAALRTLADGSVVVTTQDGTDHPVTVGASARGMSLVDGVDEGTLVRVPAEDR